MSITTNGTLLYNYAEKLYEAGIKRINISLDSLNADRYREITRGGNFADVRRGIEVANEIGFDPLKINTVIIKGVNDDEIKDFALLAVKERFSVRFIEFMPVGEDTYWHEENFVPTYKIKEEIESVARLIPLERTSSSESARIYKPENGYGTIGFISPLTKHFCQYCNRIRLTPDGRIRTCLFSDDEIDVKPILRNGGGEVEIIDFFEHAIKRKPKRHYVFDSRVKKCIRFMNSIGG